jgi:hypothetical protein
MVIQRNKSFSPSRAWLVGLVLGCCAAAAQAAPVVEQAPLDGGDSYQTMNTSGVYWADNFSIGSAIDLQGFAWWGGYAGNLDAGDDAFVVNLFSDISGSGTLLQSFTATAVRTDTTLFDVGQNAVYAYAMDVAPLVLNAGTYYLSVSNEGSSDWLWLQSSGGDAGAFSLLDDPSASWTGEPTDLAFSVLGERQGTPVPEPSALSLLGLAGMALLLARRVQRS